MEHAERWWQLLLFIVFSLLAWWLLPQAGLPAARGWVEVFFAFIIGVLMAAACAELSLIHI